MGVLAQRGKIVLDFWVKGVRCKEYIGVEATPDNVRDWKRRLRLITAQVENGTFDYLEWFPQSPRARRLNPEKPKPGGMTVKQYLETWQKHRSPFRSDGTLAPDASLHPTTWLHDEGTIKKHLLPAFGDTILSELRGSEIRAFRARLQETLKGKTVANIIGLLRAALEDAVRDGEIQANPVPREKRRRRGVMKPPTKVPFEPAEVRRILAALPKRIDLQHGAHVTGQTLYDLYLLWSLTGWRSGEIVCLRFDWLDFDKEVAAILQARSPRRGGLEARPKNDEREVPLGYAPILFEMFARRKRAAIATGFRDYVFTDSAGRPLNQETLAKRVWNPTLRTLEIMHRGQYHLRHTAATNMLEARESPGFVARVLGATEETIWKHYRRFIMALRPDSGRAFYERMMGLQVSAEPSADTQEAH